MFERTRKIVFTLLLFFVSFVPIFVLFVSSFFSAF